MKLFGSCRSAARVDGHTSGKKKMSGWKIAIIVLLALLLLLVGVVVWFLNFYAEAPDPVGPTFSEDTIDPDTGNTVVRPDEPVKDPVTQDPSVTNPEDTETPGTEEPGNDPVEDPQPEDPPVVEEPKIPKEGYYNILIAGTDHDGFRTDTLMIARLDTVNHTVALMSIPRDTIVETSSGFTKINSIYGIYGCGKRGMEALMLEVEDLLGFMPSGYAIVNLNAFVELVDLVGGVDYNVPVDMYHVDPTQDLYIDLKKGYQHLDGEKAMQLVRFRGYSAADIERTHVQQKFLVTLAKQCLTLSNLTKIGDYCDIFVRNVSTNYTANNLVYFAQELVKCNFDNMTTYTLEGEGGYYVDGIDYYKLNDEKVQKVIMEQFYPYVN